MSEEHKINNKYEQKYTGICVKITEITKFKGLVKYTCLGLDRKFHFPFTILLLTKEELNLMSSISDGSWQRILTACEEQQQRMENYILDYLKTCFVDKQFLVNADQIENYLYDKDYRNIKLSYILDSLFQKGLIKFENNENPMGSINVRLTRTFVKQRILELLKEEDISIFSLQLKVGWRDLYESLHELEKEGLIKINEDSITGSEFRTVNCLI